MLIVHAFPPRSVAGVEVYALRQAQALRELGHEVRVVTAAHDLAAEPASVRHRQHRGIEITEVVSIHEQGTLESTYENPAVRAAVRRELEQMRPSLVHVHHLLNLAAGVLADARAVGARVVLTLHDYWLSCPRDGLRMRADLGLCETMDHGRCAACLRGSPYLSPPLQRGAARVFRRAGLGRVLHRIHDVAPGATEWLMDVCRRVSPPGGADLVQGMDRRARVLREAIAEVDVILAPTRFVRDRAVDFGVAPDRIAISPYGAVEGRPRARPEGRRRRIGYIGSLAPHKGVHVLVQAFRGMTDSEARLSIHGNPRVHPSYARELREMAAEDPRIRFQDGFEEGQQAQRLAEIDLLVVPSIWWENSPLVILEALAAGAPVVASRTGGVPELIDEGRSGVLVPPGDTAALREVLVAAAEGRVLGDALAPLPLKSVVEAARELVALATPPASG